MRRIRTTRGFSLLELLVVVTILVLLIGFAVPAFSSILGSVERSIAENQLRIGISAGRDAAIANVLGDGAAVFMFEPGGRMSIVPCREITRVRDRLPFIDPQTGTRDVTRSVFIPVADSEPIQLPKGWSIRGYAPPGRIHKRSGAGANPNGWYEGQELWGELDGGGAWLFPENGFFNPIVGADGANRQSFMIRFRSGTGEVVTDNIDVCLFLDPSPESDFRSEEPWRSVPRLDRAEDLELAVRRTAATVNDALTSTPQQERFFGILGDEATDTVLVGPVIALGLYEEAKMAAGIGLRGLNRTTKSIYQADPNDARLPAPVPEFDATLRTAFGNGQTISNPINAWMVGLLPNVESDVKLFVVQVNTAELEELNP